MATTGRSTEDAPVASDIAARLGEAGFVRLVGAATGDALAASGVLARALDARDRPFQASIAPLPTEADRTTEADLTVAVGRTDPTADVSLPGGDRPASATAYDAARELATGDAAGGDPGDAGIDDDTLLLALAGVRATGGAPTGALAEAAEAAGVDRRLGLAVPTADLVDGLVHSTLVHAPFSGDRDVTSEALSAADLPVAEETLDRTDLDEDDRRRVASLVALRAVGDDDVPSRGAEAVERALRPYGGGPFGTVGGYADVLDATARVRPGTGVALALGHDVRSAALDAWRTHGERVHAGVRDATTARYDGLFVLRPESPDAPLGTVARLGHAYRSPEPLTLAVADGEAVAVADGDAGLRSPLTDAAAETDGTADVTGSTGRARFATDDEAFLTAFREAR